MNKHILKLVCLLLAVVIWIQVASSDMREREVDLPLRLADLPPSLTLAGNDWPETVRVKGRGSKWRFFLSRYFGHSPGEVVVELAGVEPDVRWVREITAGDVRSSLTEVVVLDPGPLELDIDHLDSLRVSVDVATRGALPEGLMLLTPPQARPGEITLYGPSRFLDPELRVRTEPVEMSRVQGTGPVARPLVVPHAHLRPSLESVQVVVEAVPVGRRTFEHVPLVPLLDSGQIHVEVFPPVASVEIDGPADLLAELSAAAIGLTVASSGLGPGAHTVTPAVMLPEHCGLVTLEPSEYMLVVGGAPRPDEAP